MNEAQRAKFERCLEDIRANKVDKVEFIHEEVAPSDAVALATALANNCSVTSLILFNNPIGDEGVVALAHALRGSQVTFLVFGKSLLGGPGMAALASVLHETKIDCLTLNFNSIDFEAVKPFAAALRGSKVTSLNINSNLLSDEGAEELARGLSGSPLIRLLLSNNNIGPRGAEALAAVLPGSPIVELFLSNNCIGVEGARALAAVLKDSLVWNLPIYGNRFGAEGALVLLEGIRDSTITRLDLSDTDIGREAFRLLMAVLDENADRCLVLQMQVEQIETDLNLTFRTMAGTVAATFPWSFHLPVQCLPGAVLQLARSAGITRLGSSNLKIVLPNGKVLDSKYCAPASLAEQLGISSLPAVAPQESSDSFGPGSSST